MIWHLNCIENYRTKDATVVRSPPSAASGRVGTKLEPTRTVTEVLPQKRAIGMPRVLPPFLLLSVSPLRGTLEKHTAKKEDLLRSLRVFT